VTDVDIPLYLGELRLSAVATEGGTPLDRVVFQVFEDDPDAAGGLRELVRSSSAQPEFSLPAGAYLVIARQDGAEARERVSVKPGTRLTKALILASGRLSLTSKLPARTPGRLDGDLISYRIERLGVARAAGKTEASGGSQPASAAKVEAGAEEISRTHAPEQSLALTAGKYRVESRYGAINARVQREIEIKAGATQSVAMELEAGLVTLKANAVPPATSAPAGQGGPASKGPLPPPGASPGSVVPPGAYAADVFWEIADAGGRVLWSTSQTQPRLPLAAGRYVVRAVSRNAKAELAIQVASGDDKTIEIELK
jgi:hypothetical protein